MAAEDSEHMKTVNRWLAGETVDNTVGIRVVGGPFDGRTKIVHLRQDETPPSPLRASGGPAGPTRHVYEAVRSTDAPAGWIYAHLGAEPAADN
ncbi:hypothetical protein SAMN05216223_11678 [Actinacidiphila yanglinensis]|uniref:Uncharacterized protein n=2 Tax=Actinacidiphila yanglinensis TaxID=310779 RepID=A0A1H6DJ46_9ACTN|nr:hypothetical protein SAMN05216223_11678 [Actinacidiphila yanglinensis]